jgi:hypothetical protein
VSVPLRVVNQQKEGENERGMGAEVVAPAGRGHKRAPEAGKVPKRKIVGWRQMPKGRGGNGTCDREAGRDFERDPKGNNTNSINLSQFGGGICKCPMWDAD